MWQLTGIIVRLFEAS